MIESLSLARAGALAASHAPTMLHHRAFNPPSALRARLRRLVQRLSTRTPTAPRGGCC